MRGGRAAKVENTPPGGMLQRCACGRSAGPEGECAECRARRLMRTGDRDEGKATVSPITREVLRSPGRPLDPGVRDLMESRFGHDFSRVRVHSDTDAASSAQAINALAYTAGSHIVFGAGRFAPETQAGRRLLAHELAHVIQQLSGRVVGDSAIRPTDDGFEREASQVAGRVVDWPAVVPLTRIRRPITTPPALLQRQSKEPTETDAENLCQPAAGAHQWKADVEDGLAQRLPERDTGWVIQRQGGATTPSPEQRSWYMLRVPPTVKQPGLTCWAGSLSAWLAAMGLEKKTVVDLVFEYTPRTACLADDNSLPPENAEGVFAEWGVGFVHFHGPAEPPIRPALLTANTVRTRLKAHGHLLLVEGPGRVGLDHVSVIYGTGIDDKGRPDPNFISVMDPLEGTYRNRSINGLTYPLAIGFFAGRKRPAPCRSEKRPESPESSTTE
jgi:Domain of unknown function (DUF4157)